MTVAVSTVTSNTWVATEQLQIETENSVCGMYFDNMTLLNI